MAKQWISDKRIVFPLAALIGTGVAAGLSASLGQALTLELWQVAAIYVGFITVALFAAAKILSRQSAVTSAAAQNPLEQAR